MTLAPGSRLGPYEILTLLGAGGMGEVYKATDTRLGRSVAIKIMRGGNLERFAVEARAIAALNHPHICALHDVGANFLVMEYVALKYFGDSSRSQTFGFWLGQSVQDAEPHNRVSNETLPQTLAGTVVGTAAYMSPEQAQGQPVDVRSVIFSLLFRNR